MNYLRLFLYCLPLFILSTISTAQSNKENKKFYTWFDNSIGHQNSQLYYGDLYQSSFRVINEKHQFFETDSFTLGYVDYRENKFWDVPLKYDIFNDKLLLKTNISAGARIIRLVDDEIRSFAINGHSFYYLDDRNSKLEHNPGFYEKIFSNSSLTVFKKYHKQDFAKKDRSYIYHEFVDVSPSYYIFKDETLYQWKRKDDLINHFPSQKKFISKFYRDNRRMLTRNFENFAIQILDKIENL